MQEYYKNYATEELAVMYQNTNNEDYLREIARRNEGLLYKWSRDYTNIPSYDLEDFVEEGYIALWKAVQVFDPAKGYTFTTCLKGFVRQAFNRLYTAETRKRKYNGTTPASYEELDEINREKAYTDDYTEIEMREFVEMLGGTLRTVAEFLLVGISKGDIAKQLQITPASTTYYIKKLRVSYLQYKGV